MQIKIEPVKQNEVQVLADISIKCFYDTFYQQNTEENMALFLNESFNVQTLEQEMLQKVNYFYFAKTAGEIAGYIKLSVGNPGYGIKNPLALEIARIYVLKDKIGSGIGKMLLEFAFSFARNDNRNIIWLGVWEHNHRAIDFYRKHGFEKFDEHIFMVGDDAQTDWLMKKDLNKQFEVNKF